MDTAPPSRPDESGWYEIRLHGRLDPRWSARFEGLTLTTTDGATRLTGHLVDQAALHGLLRQLRDLGLPLDSVIRTEPSDPARPPTPAAPETPGA